MKAARQALGKIDRAVAEARATDRPLLERVRHLARAGETLDAWFAQALGPLLEAPEAERSISPVALAELRQDVQTVMDAARSVWRERLQPELAQAGLHIVRYAALTEAQRQAALAHYADNIFPVLTPLALDAGRPFPQISDLSLNLAVFIERPGDEPAFARVKVPPALPRFVPVAADTWVWLEDVIAAHSPQLFPGETVLTTHAFRVTRRVSAPGPGRRGLAGAPVRLTVAPDLPEATLQLLMDNLGCEPGTAYRVAEPLGLRDLHALYALDRPDLKAAGRRRRAQ